MIRNELPFVGRSVPCTSTTCLRDHRKRSGAAAVWNALALLSGWLLCVPVVDVKAAEPAQETTSLESMMQVAQVALQACQHQGYHVSVAIVDAAGNLQVFLRSDGAAPHTLESAQRKAYTSASFGIPSSALTERAKENADIAGLAALGKVLLVSGGLPIRQGSKLLGGIGVAGSTGPGQDEACARKGLSSGSLAP